MYESMLDSVLFARDKYLNPNGMLFPDRAVLYLAVAEDEKYRDEKMTFWDNVYGVNMKIMKQWVITEPIVETINK